MRTQLAIANRPIREKQLNASPPIDLGEGGEAIYVIANKRRFIYGLSEYSLRYFLKSYPRPCATNRASSSSALRKCSSWR